MTPFSTLLAVAVRTWKWVMRREQAFFAYRSYPEGYEGVLIVVTIAVVVTTAAVAILTMLVIAVLGGAITSTVDGPVCRFIRFFR